MRIRLITYSEDIGHQIEVFAEFPCRLNPGDIIEIFDFFKYTDMSVSDIESIMKDDNIGSYRIFVEWVAFRADHIGIYQIAHLNGE